MSDKTNNARLITYLTAQLNDLQHVYGDAVLWFAPPSTGFGKIGLPHRMVIANGRFIAIEVVDGVTAAPRHAQAELGRLIQAAGAKFYVVHNQSTVHTVINGIKGMMREGEGAEQ